VPEGMPTAMIDRLPPGEAQGINFSWLLKLRWGAIVGQVITILGVDRLLHIPLPLAPLLAIIALEFISNLGCVWLARSGRPVQPWWPGAVMVFDTVLLTLLLYFSGGPFNPFSFLYLVQISLAALILSPRWTWALVLLALAGSGFLFLDYRELPLEGLSHADHMRVHLRGMWVAFGTAAFFIVYFLVRVRRALAERDAALATARSLAARQEKLASLATLAAGAAHELSTPLSTIAVVAKELDRALGDSPSHREDVHLIREQVDRCRTILEHLAADAGTETGEHLLEVPLDQIVSASMERLRDRPPVRIELDGATQIRMELPHRAIAQALGSLIKNAQDASPTDAEVVVAARRVDGWVQIDIRDRGAGMTPDELARVGEPFFTTKAPGRGMGLGLFLTRTIVERVGGQLKLDSAPQRGTTATVLLPAKSVRSGAGT
jgi:two-component system sensor histidine kinase RegB